MFYLAHIVLFYNKVERETLTALYTMMMMENHHHLLQSVTPEK